MKTFYVLAIFSAFVIAKPSFTDTRVVTNSNNVGAGSLRQTIDDAANGDSITFAASVGSSITLSSELTIIGKSLTITGPITLKGAGLDRILFIGNTTVILERIALEDGKVTGSTCGGAIQLVEAATLRANNTYFRNNRAPAGGAICIVEGSEALISASTFDSNNASTTGGAIHTDTSLRVENSTFFRNSATTNGGAIYIDKTGGREVIIASSTLVENTAEAGGGVFYNEANSYVTLENTLIADLGDAGANCAGAGAGQFQGQGNFGTDATCVASGAPFPNDEYANLHLGQLQNNGGPTPTIALGGASVAIDAGDKGVLGTYILGSRGESDQRGFPRVSPTNGQIDVGAYEFQQLATTCVPPVLSCPADKTVIREDFGGQVVNYAEPTVSSDCQIELVACSPPSGSTFQNGKTIVTCTAVDEDENTGSCTFIITIAAPGSDQCLCPADGSSTDDPNTSGIDTGDDININSNAGSGCNALGQNGVSYDTLVLLGFTLAIAMKRVLQRRKVL